MPDPELDIRAHIRTDLCQASQDCPVMHALFRLGKAQDVEEAAQACQAVGLSRDPYLTAASRPFWYAAICRRNLKKGAGGYYCGIVVAGRFPENK